MSVVIRPLACLLSHVSLPCYFPLWGNLKYFSTRRLSAKTIWEKEIKLHSFFIIIIFYVKSNLGRPSYPLQINYSRISK